MLRIHPASGASLSAGLFQMSGQIMAEDLDLSHKAVEIIGLCMGKIKIILSASQTIKQPLGVKISQCHAPPGPLFLELQDPAQISPGSDPVYIHVLRQLCPPFRIHADAVDPDHDQIFISPLCQDVHRHVVHHTAVQIRLSAQLFIFKGRKKRAG